MNKSPFARMYVDHYLQSALLSRLAAADRPLRFSEVKEDGIENSLFMYHANKLISRGAITKDDDGFALTSNGARWVNSIGPDMSYAKPTPRPLIQFVIHDDNGNVLLSTRKGQLKELLNDYMFPGGLHKSGMSADENAAVILGKMFTGMQLQAEFLTVLESINHYDDGFIYHSLSHVFAVTIPADTVPVEDDRFMYEWMPGDALQQDTPTFAKSKLVPLFMQKLQDETLQSREVITLNYT